MTASQNNATVLECVNLKKTFNDGNRDLHILQGVDLQIRRDESVAICGKSGAGKSTLLHILGTLDTPTSGEVIIEGKTVSKTTKQELDMIRSESIGFVFQFYHLLPEFNALENVMMPALGQGKRVRDCMPRAEQLLEKVGLEDRLNHKPGQLSGGEQQRVAIARALFNKPCLLLADEPTGNLDERTGTGIIELLWKLNDSESTTLVLVTHDERVASRANRTIWLHEGLAQSTKP